VKSAISNTRLPIQHPFAFTAINGGTTVGIYKESMQKDVPDWRMAMADF